MHDYVVAHFHNVAPGAEDALSAAFRGDHAATLQRLHGFRWAQRFEVTPEQLMPIVQPWRYLSLYEFQLEQPEIHLPALASPVAALRDGGLIASDDTERLYAFRMYSPWKYSSNLRPDEPFSHVMVLLANVTPGRDAEYHRWYDEQHSVEVIETPGYVSMKRGQLSDVQLPPIRYCPGDQIIMGGLQADDLKATVTEFTNRALGRSPSGIAWGERSTAASQARTVHLFKSIDGPVGDLR